MAIVHKSKKKIQNKNTNVNQITKTSTIAFLVDLESINIIKYCTVHIFN